jgi:hypothetical protein
MVFQHKLKTNAFQEIENDIKLTQNTVQMFNTIRKMKCVAVYEIAYCHNGMGV